MVWKHSKWKIYLRNNISLKPNFYLMKRTLFSVSVFSLLFMSCQKELETLNNAEAIASTTSSQAGTVIEDQYIVQLHPEYLKSSLTGVVGYEAKITAAFASIKALLSVLPDKESIRLQHVYVTAINGFAAKFTPEQIAVLKTLPEVKLIEQDVVGEIVGKSSSTPSRDALKVQSVEYGVLRTGYADGTGKRAFIIDTGIDLDHADLNVNTGLGKDFTADGGLFGSGGGLFGGGGGLFGGGLFGGGGDPGPEGDDDQGHGTHCAGIVAAKNNEIGVVGVAYNAEVVAVKVLNFLGNGNATDVIQGIDYVASVGQPGDVANLSLSFKGTQQAVNNAAINLGQLGVFVSIAAGNSSIHANNESPANANGVNVYTVSALDANDDFASFSNFGNPPIDFCAPGVNVNSTYLNNGYSSLSGTSMAAPHVAGLLLLTSGNVNTDGVVNNDPDGVADPIAHL